MTLQVGYAQDTLTPSLQRPVYLAGFGHNRLAESDHDELTVRALALSDGRTQLVCISLDLIGLGRQHCQEIERQVSLHSLGTAVLIAGTHTHHGPDTIGFWRPKDSQSGADPIFLAELKGAVTNTSVTALAIRRNNVHRPRSRAAIVGHSGSLLF